MIIKTFVEPPIENNNYLVIDEASKEAILIDCSSDILENIKPVLKENNAKLKHILLTHGHFDHITGLDIEHDADVYMHSNDAEWVEQLNQYLPMVGLPPMDVPKIDKFINDGDILKLGEKEIKVIHTPGHTQGGVCFLIDGNLFSGDTIFRESIGRCDLPGGTFDQIIESIQDKIFTLPENIVIYPGHGPKTSVGWEKENNSYFS